MVTGLFIGIILVWLAVLTVAFVGVTRHLGAAQAAGAGPSVGQGGALLDGDGPWIPSVLPDRVRDSLDRLGLPTDDLVATFFSARCGTCLEKALEIREVVTSAASNVFLIAGAEDELVQNMIETLAPTGVRVVLDPDAQNIVKGLEIKSTPFSFRVVDGQVVAKSFVRGAADYTRMTDPELRARTHLPVVSSVTTDSH
jgi:hypothetical protein